MPSLIFRMKIVEGKEDEAIAALSKMVAAVAANETGVVAYEWHRGREDPSEVTLYESYESDEALQSHTKTPHMAEFQGSIAGLFDTSAMKVEPLDKIAGVVKAG